MTGIHTPKLEKQMYVCVSVIARAMTLTWGHRERGFLIDREHQMHPIQNNI